MENRNSAPATAGVDWAASGFTTAMRNLQAFTDEIGRISRLSFTQNAKLIDDLSSARDVGDLVAIQTKFMTGMVETLNEQVRLMMSRMAELPGMQNMAETWPHAGLGLNGQSAEQAVAAPEPRKMGTPPPAAAAPAPSAKMPGASDVADEANKPEGVPDGALQAAQISRDAWQELAKAAVELLKEPPLDDSEASEAEKGSE